MALWNWKGKTWKVNAAILSIVPINETNAFVENVCDLTKSASLAGFFLLTTINYLTIGHVSKQGLLNRHTETGPRLTGETLNR